MTNRPLRLYLASSWRNAFYQGTRDLIKAEGYEVYDFMNPAPNIPGFSWSDIDSEWKNWSIRQYLVALDSPQARRGYNLDKSGLDWCDGLVLIMPSGRSAHVEAGYVRGQDKPVAVLLNEQGFEADLMYRMFRVITGDPVILQQSLKYWQQELHRHGKILP